MNVLVIGRTKDEADKMKKRIYDVKFGKMYSAYPELKGKVNKDV
jgi:Ca2+-binding EF-hand superfamily protein